MSMLRELLRQRGWGLGDLARLLGVDRKTVERWAAGRGVPRPRSRAVAADLLGVEQDDLWPEVAPAAPAPPDRAGIEQVWVTRAEVPSAVWEQVLGGARSRLDVLVYGGLYLVQRHGLARHVERVAAGGGTVRLLLGDPESAAVEARGRDELVPSLASWSRRAADELGQCTVQAGVQVRLHQTPLYASIVRGDDLMLVNVHTWGLPAPANPVLLVRRRRRAGLFGTYASAFERVWRVGTPVVRGED